MIGFEGVKFGYGSGAPILSDVSVDLAPGRLYLLTGPSGAGKTTFLRLCLMEALPRAGRLTLWGQAAQTLDRDAIAGLRQRIGVVHQEGRFLDHLDLRRNIALPLQIAGRHGPDQEADIDDLLAWVGLTHRAGARPPELSGGERQRAALARAVMLSPELIVADEPTGNIDADMSARIVALLVELNRLGRTILIATHDMDLVRSVKAETAPVILRLKAGRLERAEARA
ncbi:MAG: ATP-binding cassette domain-containing protein [Pseudomonadota bacterium]